MEFEVLLRMAEEQASAQDVEEHQRWAHKEQVAACKSRSEMLRHDLLRLLTATSRLEDRMAFLRHAAQAMEAHRASRRASLQESAPPNYITVDGVAFPHFRSDRDKHALFRATGDALKALQMVEEVYPENDAILPAFRIAERGLSYIKSTGWAYMPGATSHDLTYGVKA